jgi:hypothetical protein
MSLYVADLLPFEIDAKIVNDCLKTLSQPFIKYLADDAPAPDVIKLIVGCANAKRTPAQTNNEPQKQSTTAPEFLTAGINHMQARASTYDAPAGERSMAKTVAIFNTYAGTEITEEQGWHWEDYNMFGEVYSIDVSEIGEDDDS